MKPTIGRHVRSRFNRRRSVLLQIAFAVLALVVASYCGFIAGSGLFQGEVRIFGGGLHETFQWGDKTVNLRNGYASRYTIGIFSFERANLLTDDLSARRDRHQHNSGVGCHGGDHLGLFDCHRDASGKSARPRIRL